MKEKVVNLKSKITEFAKVNSRILKLILIILVLIIVIWIICSCITGKSVGNDAGNLYNGGTAVKKGNWIYYVKPNGGIYKAKGKKVKEVTQDTGKYLNIDGNYIYYAKYNSSKNEYDLTKIKTNGKKSEVLVENIDDGMAVTVTDKWIFYSKSGNLTRCNKKGEDRTTISKKNIMKYQISGKNIFYSYNKDQKNYLSKMDLNGQDDNNGKIVALDILTQGAFWDFYVKGNKIYYIQGLYDANYNITYTLRSTNFKGEKDKEICELPEELKRTNMADDGVYYITSDNDTYKIRKINYNGKNDKEIGKTEISNILNVLDKYIVYSDYNEDNDLLMYRITTKGEDKTELK